MEKKSAQKAWFMNLVNEKPFGHQVIHQGYSLMFCPGQDLFL